MATELLATGSTAASSSDLTVTDAVAIGLKDLVDGTARVLVELKDDDLGYNAVGELTSYKTSARIDTPGVYRFTRQVGGACGVYSA